MLHPPRAAKPAALATAFVAENTRLQAPPLVRELKLHLADETLAIWRKTEEELAEMSVPSPFWAFAWAGGQALARYILDNPETVAGKSVVDLGSGSGIVAIAAKQAGARDVLAVDTDPYAVAAIALNMHANAAEIEIAEANLLGREAPEADVLLLGDLFYDQLLADDVLAFAMSMADKGASVLAGDPRRTYFPQHRFEKLAAYSVPVTRELEDAEIKKCAVWQLSR